MKRRAYESTYEDFVSSEPSSQAGPDTWQDDDLVGDHSRPRLPGSQSPVRPGRKLGRYVIMRELGSGGMGVVYEAFDPQLERRAALKMLRKVDARGEHELQRRLSERLMREGQALARLSSEYVPAVYDVGIVDSMPYIATEMIVGRSLNAWLTESRRSWAQVVQVMVQVGAGLAAAHAAGLVHRDVKPDNILIGRDGVARIVDFGLVGSELTHAPGEGARDALDEEATRSRLRGPEITRHGSVMGTPAYMSPEQHRGEPADSRCDQFGFCVALFEALHGTRPFGYGNHAEIAKRACAGEISSSASQSARTHRTRRVPRWLRAIVLRGLTADASRRFSSMRDLLAAVDAGMQRARRLRLAGLLALACVSAIVAHAWLSMETVVSACEREAGRAERVWDDEARETVRAKFAKLGPFARATWTSVEPKFDQYRDEWTRARRGTCGSRRPDSPEKRVDEDGRTLDRRALRRQCLDTRIAAFAELVTVSKSADAEVVRNAATAVEGLPLLSACETPDPVLLRHPPPRDARRRAEFDALELELVRLTTLRVSGRARGNLARASEALARAEILGHVPLLARMEYELAKWHPRTASERELLDAAYLHALASHMPGVAFDAGIDWVFASVLARGPSVDTDDRLTRLKSHLTTADDEGRRRLRHAQIRGIALDLGGRADLQLREYERAMRFATQRWGRQSEEASDMAAYYGGALMRVGDFDRAIEVLEPGVRFQAARLPPLDPRLVWTMKWYLAALLADARTERSLESTRVWSDRCLRTYRASDVCEVPLNFFVEAALGAGRLHLANQIIDAHGLQCRTGDFGLAALHLRIARGELQSAQKLRQECKRGRGRPMTPLRHAWRELEQAVLYFEISHLDEALGILERLDVGQFVGEDGALLRAEKSGLLARIYFARNQFSRSILAAERSFLELSVLGRNAAGSDPQATLSLNLVLSRALRNAGYLQHAKQRLVDIRAALEGGFGPEDHRMSNYWVERGHLALALETPRLAAEHYRRALELFDAREVHPNRRAEALFGLARSQWRVSDRADRSGRAQALRWADAAADLYANWDLGGRAQRAEVTEWTRRRRTSVARRALRAH